MQSSVLLCISTLLDGGTPRVPLAPTIHVLCDIHSPWHRESLQQDDGSEGANCSFEPYRTRQNYTKLSKTRTTRPRVPTCAGARLACFRLTSASSCERDEFGRSIFHNIEITLVCDDCRNSEHPEACRHKTSSMPRWLSSNKVEVVRTLLAEDPVRGPPLSRVVPCVV